MGTTLTGTTPQDTYDSLIKVTDNGPLSGSLKTLTDGLGNDSALALSTSAIRVTGAISGTNSFNGFAGATQNLLIDWSSSSQMTTLTNTELFFGTNANRRLTISADGNVGIGTSSPAALLSLYRAADASININTAATGTFPIKSGISFGAATTSLGGDNKYLGGAGIQGVNIMQSDNVTDLLFWTTSGGSPSEKVRVLSSGGITFNGDTAAANALDDYEEGTWTMGVAFGGASVGVTTNLNTGAYTKVGNKVTVTGFLQLSSKGSSTGVAKITGLPFTLPANLNRLSAPSLWFNNITFANQFQGYCDQNSTNIDLYEITEAGVATALTNADFANNSEIMLSATYFV